MLNVEGFSIYIMICVLAPLIGAFTLLFLFIFEKRIDLLEQQKYEIALERELQRAQYNQLNQEIQPHFFFNTLNSILSLARLDRKQELIRSIETLSKLLKFKYQTNKSFITIEEELTYVKYYLEIQKIRFRDRLHYEIGTCQDVQRAIVIPYLVQTLVENAFKHSFEKYIGEALLKITITKNESGMVQISVWNNSIDSQEEDSLNSGLGLENISKRLELLFPDSATVQLSNNNGGTTVTAIFPLMLNSEV